MPMISLTVNETGRAVLVNSDWIAYGLHIDRPNEHTVLTLGLQKTASGNLHTVLVKEKLEQIGDLIRSASEFARKSAAGGDGGSGVGSDDRALAKIAKS